MSFQAYLDNIKTKTGMTPADFRRAAESEGMLRPGVKTGEIVAWLKHDYDLGRGHAMAIVLTLKSSSEPKTVPEDGISRHFKGDRGPLARALRNAPRERSRLRPRRFGRSDQHVYQLPTQPQEVRHRPGHWRPTRRRHQAQG